MYATACAQAELPSLTDTYTREVLISEYNSNLPPYMWLGLRSYGDGKLFWSDGSFSPDGLLDAWAPGEFGDHACAIIVGPNGANVTLRVSAAWLVRPDQRTRPS